MKRRIDENGLYIRKKKRIRERKQWYYCNGGPWSGKRILLPSNSLFGCGATLVFRCGTFLGRYEHSGHLRLTWINK